MICSHKCINNYSFYCLLKRNPLAIFCQCQDFQLAFSNDSLALASCTEQSSSPEVCIFCNLSLSSKEYVNTDKKYFQKLQISTKASVFITLWDTNASILCTQCRPRSEGFNRHLIRVCTVYHSHPVLWVKRGGSF